MISSLPKPLNRRLSRFYSESQLIVWYPWKQLQGLLLELQKIRAHNCTVKMMKHTNTQHNASVSPDRRVRKMLRPVGPTTRDGRERKSSSIVVGLNPNSASCLSARANGSNDQADKYLGCIFTCH